MNCLRVVNYAYEQRKIVKFMYDKNVELNRTEARKIDIDVGESVDLVVNIPNANQELIYDWCCEANDIQFSVKDPNGVEIIPPARHNCNLSTEPFYGRFKSTVPGDYLLTFSNEHSWFKSKTIWYHYLVMY